MLDLGRTFLQSVERSPNTLALVDGDVRLTYAQWHDTILKAAGGLRELGLARGDRLVAVLQNRWEMATLHWACQFAGIVMTPLNWRAKPDELDYCVSESGRIRTGVRRCGLCERGGAESAAYRAGQCPWNDFVRCVAER